MAGQMGCLAGAEEKKIYSNRIHLWFSDSHYFHLFVENKPHPRSYQHASSRFRHISQWTKLIVII